jgi:hypothetical protein
VSFGGDEAASFWKRVSLRSGSSRSSAGVSGTFSANRPARSFCKTISCLRRHSGVLLDWDGGHGLFRQSQRSNFISEGHVSQREIADETKVFRLLIFCATESNLTEAQNFIKTLAAEAEAAESERPSKKRANSALLGKNSQRVRESNPSKSCVFAVLYSPFLSLRAVIRAFRHWRCYGHFYCHSLKCNVAKLGER